MLAVIFMVCSIGVIWELIRVIIVMLSFERFQVEAKANDNCSLSGPAVRVNPRHQPMAAFDVLR